VSQTRRAESQEHAGPLGFVAPPDIHIECEAFQGSLAMLFHCVRERKVDLLGVPLAPICEAYFTYLLANADQDIESAATAMTALAYLLERKAWALIPRPEEAEPDADDLLDEVEPYAHEFHPAIEALRGLQDQRANFFFRPADAGERTYELPFEIGEATTVDLARVLERLLERAVPDPIEPVGRPRRSLSEQMTIVMRALTADYRPLDQVVVGEFTRSEIVWWFLALLELIRLGQARLKIEDGEIMFAKGDGSEAR
jgi:segregation and condensation protein A